MVDPPVLTWILGLVSAAITAAARYIYKDFDEKLRSTEERLSDLEDRHNETRRMSEAVYAAVFGNGNHDESLSEQVSDIDDLMRRAYKLESEIRTHEQVIDMLLEESDLDVLWRKSDGPPDDGNDDR